MKKSESYYIASAFIDDEYEYVHGKTADELWDCLQGLAHPGLVALTRAESDALHKTFIL